MKDVMVDIETLGKRAGCIILSIGDVQIETDTRVTLYLLEDILVQKPLRFVKAQIVVLFQIAVITLMKSQSLNLTL